MAHFAKIVDGIVTQVIVVNNSDCLDSEGNESELVGKVYCNRLLGGEWVQTSYNGNFRKQYAGIGFSYDTEKDIFISQQPYPSWSLDDNSDWIPPTPSPKDGKPYIWNEENQIWVEL